MNKLHFAGTDFCVDASELDERFADDLKDCGASGDASDAVAYVRQTYSITGDEADCAAYLRGYGAWDDDELSDHNANLDRLVWLTGCSLRDGETVYFSTY